MNEKELLNELRNWCLNHSSYLLKEQFKQKDDKLERFYHGSNCAYINVANAIDALLKGEKLK